jgi:hypothetical protein
MDSLHPGMRHGRAMGLFLWLGITFLLGCLIPPALLLYWAFDNQPPLAAPAARFARWDENQPGVALVEWSAVRNRSCPGLAYRWLIGDRIWELPAETVPYAGSAEVAGGGRSRWVVPLRIPPPATQDAWPMSYRVSFEWHCNPLQRWLPITAVAPDAEIPRPPGPVPDAPGTPHPDFPPPASQDRP